MEMPAKSNYQIAGIQFEVSLKRHPRPRFRGDKLAPVKTGVGIYAIVFYKSGKCNFVIPGKRESSSLITNPTTTNARSINQNNQTIKFGASAMI